MTTCLICPAVTAVQGADGWTPWDLAEDIVWRSAFTESGEEPPLAAGVYFTCPTCTPWVPRHRTGHLPAAALQSIHAMLTTADLHPTTRRRLHAESVGRLRHLASLLQPIKSGSDSG